MLRAVALVVERQFRFDGSRRMIRLSAAGEANSGVRPARIKLPMIRLLIEDQVDAPFRSTNVMRSSGLIEHRSSQFHMADA